MGNVRLSYADSDHDGGILPRDMNSKYCEDMGDGNMACYDVCMPGEVVEVNNYYPFGLMHNYTATTMNSYQYKYNGKELQETGMYDYGARFYMPDIGRWGVVDPLAEASRRFTTYHYGNNNPIRFIDPDGRLTMDNLSTFSNGSAVADFINKNGFGEDYLPMFYRDEAGMMIVNQSLGDNGQGGGGGNSGSPTFQFPKGQEEYYKKNYPAFYDFVKNQLPNIIKDKNFLQAFMDITGMSQEEVTKAFTYGDGPTLHDWDVEFSNGQYDYSVSHYIGDLNSISIGNTALNWFEKANKNPNTVEGIANLFWMSSLVGHEGAHWGHNIKGPTQEMNSFINIFQEHGDAFEFRIFMKDFPGVKAEPGYLQVGAYNSLPYNLTQYVKIHYNTLSKIFKP